MLEILKSEDIKFAIIEAFDLYKTTKLKKDSKIKLENFKILRC